MAETTLLPNLQQNHNYRFFPNAIGTIDGVHTLVSPPKSEHAKCHNRKGQLSLNHLAACDFNMWFTYVLSGWEGSVADGFLFAKATASHDLSIPPNKYYLADTGFVMTPKLMLPFREWSQGNDKPKDQQELYNLQNATARNVIERVFGVMKDRFKIIREANRYDLKTNARIMSVLAALHNFICCHDGDDIPEPWEEEDAGRDKGGGGGGGGEREVREVATRHDRIAREMWWQYMEVLENHHAVRHTQAAHRRANARPRAQTQ